MRDTFHHIRDLEPLGPTVPDISTPKHAFCHLHLIAIAAANGGHGFPFMDTQAISQDPRPAGGLKGILEAVSREYQLPITEILSKSRRDEVVRPRQDFMWRARQVKWPDGKHRYSSPFIARFLGMEDHTTVLYGARRHQERLEAEAAESVAA